MIGFWNVLGLANAKTVTIQPGKDQSVVLATSKTRKQNKPSALLHKSVMKKEFRRMAKAVTNQVFLSLLLFLYLSRMLLMIYHGIIVLVLRYLVFYFIVNVWIPCDVVKKDLLNCFAGWTCCVCLTCYCNDQFIVGLPCLTLVRSVSFILFGIF